MIFLLSRTIRRSCIFRCAETQIPFSPLIRVMFLRMMISDLLYSVSLQGGTSRASVFRKLRILGASILHNAEISLHGGRGADVLLMSTGLGIIQTGREMVQSPVRSLCQMSARTDCDFGRSARMEVAISPRGADGIAALSISRPALTSWLPEPWCAGAIPGPPTSWSISRREPAQRYLQWH